MPVNGDMKLTALFVCLGILFDFLDGFIARKLRVQSVLGVQLDSLADLVTSGGGSWLSSLLSI